jgi:hypothetical protein
MMAIFGGGQRRLAIRDGHVQNQLDQAQILVTHDLVVFLQTQFVANGQSLEAKL